MPRKGPGAHPRAFAVLLDWSMPWRGALLALILVLSAGPAWAVRDWYDYYEDGKQQAARGRCKEALASLAQARRLKPSSELHVRLYGIVFIDYVPYYYEGVCQVKTGDFKAALQSFAAEEKQGVIQKDRELHADRHGRDQAVDLVSDGVTSLPGGAVVAVAKRCLAYPSCG